VDLHHALLKVGPLRNLLVGEVAGCLSTKGNPEQRYISPERQFLPHDITPNDGDYQHQTNERHTEHW
jgi:hypothetical protein